MGSDDQFKKRKEQKAAELERRRNLRATGPRFLIVCEGLKTEPYYFEEFCEYHKIRTPRVRISPGDKGPSPDRIVDRVAGGCLYVVFDCGTPMPRLFRIANPFGKLLAKSKATMIINGRELKDAELRNDDGATRYFH